mmetsp:Transcript_80116/g.179294  ORF Transcript_80116/g.179294 Transcript_80116/m.179294 type:complete len:507 (-) Transcript_80116:87-1607(-)
MIGRFQKWWGKTVPLEVHELTQEWVTEALREAGIDGDIRDVQVRWLNESDVGAGGATGSKLFKVVASFKDSPSLVMVYKAMPSTYYGEMSFGERAMFAIMEPSIHNALALGHNLPFNEGEFYDAFVVRQTLQPGLPTPRVFAACSRGNRISRVGLFTMKKYRNCANGLLMEDLTAQGFRGFGQHVDVGTEVARAALVDLARFHGGHWGKPYVRKRDPPVTVMHWFGRTVLENRDFCRHLERGALEGRLVRDLLAARGQGLLVKSNLPERAPRPELLQPARARSSLPELFEPLDGTFFTALHLLEAGQAALLARVRRLIGRRDTLLMGDAHSGNIFARDTPASRSSEGSPEVRWIDFQHWGSGAAALDVAYFFMGAVDAKPGRDAELLRLYHAEFEAAGGGQGLHEFMADTAAAILSLASAALFHYPIYEWPGGSGIINCFVDPNNLAAAPGKVRDAERSYRMIYRMIQRVPLILGDSSHPLTLELLAREEEVLRSRPVGGGPRSRL